MENLEKYELLKIYCGEIPEFIRKLAATNAIQRLKHVGMNCGCEYTGIHSKNMARKYSRFEHSVGVALIVWNFTNDMKQSVAGLFHDISTPSFAHVVDYMNGDHIRQESTEVLTTDFISDSNEIQQLLNEYSLKTEEVSDYHLFPIADNDSPKLSADRLEYTFGNFLQYCVTDIHDIERFYGNLAVGTNERSEEELIFTDKRIAEEFALYSMKCSHIYVSDSDRFAVQYLADLLKIALENGVVSVADLYTTEENVVEKLESSEITAHRWREHCGFKRVQNTSERVSDRYCVQVNAKRRYIDPYVRNVGRVAEFSGQYRTAVNEFLRMNFDGWLSIAE